MSAGYVYVLWNESFPGLVKIGRSKHGGLVRARNIYQTGVPAPFKLVFECSFDDAAEAEILVHDALYKERVNNNREFFKCEGSEAIQAVLQVAAEYINHCVEDVDSIVHVSDLYDAHQKTGLKNTQIPGVMAMAISYRFIEPQAIKDGYLKWEAWFKERVKKNKAESGNLKVV